MYITFGERLTVLRKKGYATRSQFADRLKMPDTALCNYESDAGNPGHTFKTNFGVLQCISTWVESVDDKDVNGLIINIIEIGKHEQIYKRV